MKRLNLDTGAGSGRSPACTPEKIPSSPLSLPVAARSSFPARHCPTAAIEMISADIDPATRGSGPLSSLPISENIISSWPSDFYISLHLFVPCLCASPLFNAAAFRATDCVQTEVDISCQLRAGATISASPWCAVRLE